MIVAIIAALAQGGPVTAFAQSIPEDQSCGGLLCDLGVIGRKTPPAALAEPAATPKTRPVRKPKRIAKARPMPPAAAAAPAPPAPRDAAAALAPPAPPPFTFRPIYQ